MAKGASAMILTDDNFVNIVAAVEKGRVIYAGIQKFVSFIMSVHIGEVMQIFLCILFNVPVMRTPLQILFLILVTDLPPSIALGDRQLIRNKDAAVKLGTRQKRFADFVIIPGRDQRCECSDVLHFVGLLLC